MYRHIEVTKLDQGEEGRFTPREIIAHLADCEIMFLNRLKAAVEKPGTEVPFFDEDQRAIDLNYNQADVVTTIQSFADRRMQTVEYVKSIENRNGFIIHPEQGNMDTRDVIYTIAGHDAYHIEQLSYYIER